MRTSVMGLSFSSAIRFSNSVQSLLYPWRKRPGASIGDGLWRDICRLVKTEWVAAHNHGTKRHTRSRRNDHLAAPTECIQQEPCQRTTLWWAYRLSCIRMKASVKGVGGESFQTCKGWEGKVQKIMGKEGSRHEKSAVRRRHCCRRSEGKRRAGLILS